MEICVGHDAGLSGSLRVNGKVEGQSRAEENKPRGGGRRGRQLRLESFCFMNSLWAVSGVTLTGRGWNVF